MVTAECRILKEDGDQEYSAFDKLENFLNIYMYVNFYQLKRVCLSMHVVKGRLVSPT